MAHPLIASVKASYDALAAKLSKVDEDICSPVQAGGCFIKGTRVHTKEGLKPIEEIQVGDWVLSQPKETGELAYKRVARTAQHEDKAVWRIGCYVKKDGEFINEFYVVTGGHPVYVVSQYKEDWYDEGEWDALPKKAGWCRADWLTDKDIVLLSNGDKARISLVDPIWRTSAIGIGWIAAGRDAEFGRLIDLRDGRVSEDFEGICLSEFDRDTTFGIRHETPEMEDEWAYKCSVYNFEVEFYQSYYVGELGVWVRDAC